MIGFVSGFGRRGVLLVAAVLAAGGLRAAAFPMRREFFANA